MRRGGGAARAFALALLVVVGSQARAGGESVNEGDVKPPSRFELPFDGPGQIATIWSWGPNRPDGGKALVLTVSGRSRRLDVEAPTRVRWRSPNELLLEQAVQPVRDGSGTRIARITGEGAVLAVLSDREGLAAAQPSHDGRWVALERHGQQGPLGCEIRDLEAGFRVHASCHSSDLGSTAHAVWSPDGDQIAVAVRVREERGLVPRLALLSRDDPRLKRLPDRPAGEQSETGGVVPLFWNADGIYARSHRGLLRCSAQGSGCALVYAPGDAKFAFAGVEVGEKNALLLVQDLNVDPLEVRAKEIHEVNLATGEGRVLLRLPDGVFISDLDWITGGS